ncbi:MAG: hypothetical protein ACT4PZ_12830 [Panacagrimonas sp.]
MKDKWLDLLRKRRAYALWVLLPLLLLCLYYAAISSDRYVSTAQFIVESDSAAAVSSVALGLLSTGGGEAGQDAQLVMSFILSPAMLEHLDRELNLRAHFSQPDIDVFSRLRTGASREKFFSYYTSHVEVEIGEAAPIIELNVQAFDREFSQKLARAIAERAERFVNEVGQGLAREQVAFVQGEVERANARLQAETRKLVQLQNRNRMINPEAETQAVGAIIASLQQGLSQERTELKALQSFLSATAPEVVTARKKIAAIESQIEQERGRQVKGGKTAPLNDLLLEFKEAELSVQIAADVYQGGLKSLEAAKLDASRKVKHLVRVSAPTLPDASIEPRRLYNLATFFLFANLIYLVGGLLLASIRDHQE